MEEGREGGREGRMKGSREGGKQTKWVSGYSDAADIILGLQT